MIFLLDTDTCVHWLRGNPIIRSRFAAVGPEMMAVSIITLAELYYGAECSARPEANHQAIDDFTSGVVILGVEPEAARTFGEIKGQLRKQGNILEDFDILLAATAQKHGLTLVTGNRDHFGRIAGLVLENWLEA
jgi:predicted nucleic acid-binding protein